MGAHPRANPLSPFPRKPESLKSSSLGLLSICQLSLQCILIPKAIMCTAVAKTLLDSSQSPSILMTACRLCTRPLSWSITQRGHWNTVGSCCCVISRDNKKVRELGTSLTVSLDTVCRAFDQKVGGLNLVFYVTCCFLRHFYSTLPLSTLDEVVWSVDNAIRWLALLVLLNALSIG